MKSKLYIFSGLGADKRIFTKLDLSAFDCVFIDWITPEKNESLQNYALRISKNIPQNGVRLMVYTHAKDISIVMKSAFSD